MLFFIQINKVRRWVVDFKKEMRTKKSERVFTGVEKSKESFHRVKNTI